MTEDEMIDAGTEESTVRIEQYTWEGDTWWQAKSDCPECDGGVGTNGTVIKCYSCGWWGVLDDE